MFALVSACLTFPGVVVHELAHRWFCWLFGARVVKACYFRLGNPAGYVVYEAPRNTYHHILICVGPFVVNTVIGAAVAYHGAMRLLPLGNAGPVDYLLVWLGISIAAHAFPSKGDAGSIWRGLWTRPAPIFARLIGTPIVGLIYLGALGSMLWLDIAYGLAVAVWLPRWLLG